MSEKFENPFVDNLVGLPTEHRDKQEAWGRYIEEQIRVQGGKKIEGYEIEKEPRDLEIIEVAQKAVDEMYAEYGRKKVIPVPLDNIHVLKPGGTLAFTQKFQGASHATLHGSIAADRDKSDTKFALYIFHELAHLKAYKSFQVVTSPEGSELKPYRTGFSMMSRDGKLKSLENFEEAVIATLCERFYKEVLPADPLFSDEIQEFHDKGQSPHISRGEEVASLNKFIDEIFEKNQERFHSRNEVADLFIKAHVTGNLLTVGKLIKKTYGKGSFRTMAQAY